MAVYEYFNGKTITSYEGCVLSHYERNGYEDSDWYAVVWDEEEQEVKNVEYMTTRFPSSGDAKVDATKDVLRKAYRYYKKLATPYVDRQILQDAARIRKGDVVRIVKGRKVKIGSEVTVFWAGTRYNPYSRVNENRIGVEVNGERIFIASQNAEVVGWENRVLHGKKRKELIRRQTVEMMPYNCRKFFQ